MLRPLSCRAYVPRVREGGGEDPGQRADTRPLITRKAGAALAAGCTLVVKPAEDTPLTALALGLLAERAGMPPGVINLVTGDPVPIGGELTANPIVRKLSFTGSTAVGRLLMRQCADTLKRLSLELGGNAPFIREGSRYGIEEYLEIKYVCMDVGSP